MTEGEIRQRVRAALLDKRGSELILSLVEEIVNLNIRTELALRQIQALKSFESLKDHLITVDAAKTADPRPTALKLDASQLFNPKDGFHNLEYSPTGVPYRWTGPTREFSFNVFVGRTQPVALALRATKLMEPELQSELVLIADGEPMNLTFEREDDAWVARAVLPARTDLGATHLVFVSASVASPPDSADARTLGIAFSELDVRPAMEAADSRFAAAPGLNGGSPADPLATSGPVLPGRARPRRARASGPGRTEIDGTSG